MKEKLNSQDTGVKNTTPNRYQSLDKQIQEMKLTFSNAKLPSILPQLQTLGYSEERLNGYLAKLAELESLALSQEKEYADQYTETEKFNTKRTQIDELYRRHLAFAKILFKGDSQARNLLGFAGDRKTAYADWYQQVSSFYTQILNNAEISAKMATINITKEHLQNQQVALIDLATLKESQKKEVGEAQKATETRDKAFDALYPHYTELVAYAKVLFQDDQLLETLGIVVKR